MASLPFRHFIDGSLAFVFPILTWQTLRSAFSENAHHSGLFTRAASGGLRPGPATRSRGAHPHLLCSKAFLDDHLDLLSCRRGTQSRGEVTPRSKPQDATVESPSGSPRIRSICAGSSSTTSPTPTGGAATSPWRWTAPNRGLCSRRRSARSLRSDARKRISRTCSACGRAG